ncbi:MAG: flagellar biosynthetic protein FliP [Deltaproteobacteria bacterium]|nr:MAG: flagellar biosynthetic protein FliP [Deltaproteobacteria bacterium]
MKRKMVKRGGLLEVVHYHPFGQKKGVALVRLLGEYLVLGVTEQQISLLTKVEASRVEEVLSLPEEKVTSGKKSFRAVLRGLLALLFAFVILAPGTSHAAGKGIFSDGILGFSSPLELLVIFTLLSILPAILVMCTSFTRLVVVFSFLRQAMGTPQVPPSQVIVGLSLFVTLFIMSPVLDRVYTEAYLPYRQAKISGEAAFSRAEAPLKEFMLKQVNEKDLALFLNMAKVEKPKRPEDLPLRVVVPAFAVGELKKAFQIGFLLFLPFVVIDMVVASVLLSLGMMMLPPVMISMPFKLLLFVLVDGWDLIVVSMVRGFM